MDNNRRKFIAFTALGTFAILTPQLAQANSYGGNNGNGKGNGKGGNGNGNANGHGIWNDDNIFNK